MFLKELKKRVTAAMEHRMKVNQQKKRKREKKRTRDVQLQLCGCAHVSSASNC